MELNDNLVYAMVGIIILLVCRFIYIELFSKSVCSRPCTQNEIIDTPASTSNVTISNTEENMKCTGYKCYV